MAKKITGFIKLQVKAQQANPAPPIGPALGQYGVNIMAFCKEFNEKTKDVTPGAPVPVVITVYSDKSFSFIRKTMPAAFLLRQRLKQDIANKTQYVTEHDLEELAKIKMTDLTSASLAGAKNTLAGTAKSMKISIYKEQ